MRASGRPEPGHLPRARPLPGTPSQEPRPEPACLAPTPSSMNASPFPLIRWNKQLEPEFLFPRKAHART